MTSAPKELGGAAGGLLRVFRTAGRLVFRLLIGKVYEQRYTRFFAHTMMGGGVVGALIGAITGLICLRMGEIYGDRLDVGVRSGFVGIGVGLGLSLILGFIVREPREQQISIPRPSSKDPTVPKNDRDIETVPADVLVEVYEEAAWIQEISDGSVPNGEIEGVKQRPPLFKHAYLKRYSAARAYGLNPAAAHSMAKSPPFGGCFLIIIGLCG